MKWLWGMIVLLVLVGSEVATMQETLGGYIAFVAPAEGEGNTDIFIADLATGRVRNVTNNRVQTANPTWSGDGSQLAFNNVLDGNPEIFVMEANGLDQRNVTNHPAFDVSPDWSPVSNEIAFMSNRENGKYDLYVLDLNTSETRRLTTDGIDKNHPRWSPDATRIIYWQIDGEAVPLKMIDVATGEITTLVSEGQNIWPAWSPDGSKIAVHSEETGTAQIYVVDIASGERIQITSGDAINIRPAWSPDGTKLSFVSNRNGSYDLFLMSSDGSDIQPLIEAPGDDISPAWRAGVPEIDFAANPLIPQSAVRVSQESISGDEQSVLGEGIYRLFAPKEANLKDVIRVRLEVALAEIDSVPEADIPLRGEGDLTIYRYMGAQLSGFDLERFEVFPDPTEYLLQIQEGDSNYWEWYLRPKDDEALGQRFFIVEIYLPDIADDGVVTKDIQQTIYFDLEVISGEPQADVPVDLAVEVDEPGARVIYDSAYVQDTVQPEPTEGISVYLNSENLLALNFTRDVNVNDMRIASGVADYMLPQIFPDLVNVYNNTVPTDFCLFFERDGTRDVPPLACQTENRLQLSINAGDVFWYSPLSRTLQDVVIRFGSKTFVCSPRFERCDF